MVEKKGEMSHKQTDRGWIRDVEFKKEHILKSETMNHFNCKLKKTI